MRQVRCTTPGCEHAGIVRDVPDVRVVRGVVQRPELYCEACGMALPSIVRQPPVETAVTGPSETTARRTARARKDT